MAIRNIIRILRIDNLEYPEYKYIYPLAAGPDAF